MIFKDYIIEQQEKDRQKARFEKMCPKPTEEEQVEIDLFDFNQACNKMEESLDKALMAWGEIING